MWGVPTFGTCIRLLSLELCLIFLCLFCQIFAVLEAPESLSAYFTRLWQSWLDFPSYLTLNFQFHKKLPTLPSPKWNMFSLVLGLSRQISQDCCYPTCPPGAPYLPACLSFKTSWTLVDVSPCEKHPTLQEVKWIVLCSNGNTSDGV